MSVKNHVVILEKLPLGAVVFLKGFFECQAYLIQVFVCVCLSLKENSFVLGVLLKLSNE